MSLIASIIPTELGNPSGKPNITLDVSDKEYGERQLAACRLAPLVNITVSRRQGCDRTPPTFHSDQRSCGGAPAIKGALYRGQRQFSHSLTDCAR